MHRSPQCSLFPMLPGSAIPVLRGMLRCSRRAAAGLIIAVALELIPASFGFAQTPLEDLALGQAVFKSGRTALVADAMQLSEEEGKAFWPLHREYWAAMDQINDALVKIVLEYAALYPSVPEERAREMLKEYTTLEQKRLDARTTYLKNVAKTLSSAKALRLAQVENRLDLTVRVQMAGALPLVPAQSK